MKRPEEEYLTVKEACQLLNVSRTTLMSAIHDGRLPVLRVGPRSIRIRRDKLEDLETQRL